MKKHALITPVLLALVLPVCAADRKKSQDTGITHEQAEQILEELRQIRQLLEKGVRPAGDQAPARPGDKVQVKIESTAWLGDKNAPLTMVEFTDYQCTFCRRFHLETFPELRKKYIDTGKLRFASRDMPLDFHSNALRAAEAARCAGEQGQFWAMRDRLVSNADRLSDDDIGGYAKDLKLDVPAFQSCLASGKYADAIRDEVTLAASYGINGTPSFVIGSSTPDGVSGTVVVGALPLAAFEAKLKQLSK
jgi:protein-disulfide isomerase